MHHIKGALSTSDNKCKQFSLSGKLGILFVNELAGSLSPYCFANTGICINWAVVVVLLLAKVAFDDQILASSPAASKRFSKRTGCSKICSV